MAPSEAASQPAAGGASLVIWADEKRAKAIKPLAEKWATDNGVTVTVEAIASDIQTKFKTASQGGTGPDIVVWAHDVIGDFVRNGAIDPIQMSDTSMFDPIAVKGMTFNGQLYGIPYSVENIALIRNTDLTTDCPATMEDLVKTGQQLIKDKKASQIMALQVGQKGDAYHIYPLFTSGGGSYFATTATGDPDPKTVTVDSAESIAAGQKLYDAGREGRRRPEALDRRQERDPDRSPARRPRSSCPARGPSRTSRRPRSTTTSARSRRSPTGRRPRRSSASTASTSPARARTRPSPRSS